MGMLRTCIDIKVSVESSAQTVFGEHATDSVLEDALGMGSQHLGRSGLALTSRISGVVLINLISHLFTRENDFFGIDDNHIVTTVNMRSIARFGLASQNIGDSRGQTAYRLILSIDKNPLLLHGVLVGRDCFVT